MAGLIVVPILLWEVAVRAGILQSSLAPAPSAVVTAIRGLFEDGLLYDLRVTATYVIVAFLLALITGTVLGVVLAQSERVAQVVRGFLTFLLSIPKSLFLPLFILILGIGALQKIAFGVFSAFAVIVVATMVGISTVDQNLLQMARSQGASRAQMFVKVHLRSMAPTLLEAARIAMILNITGVLIAEMYVSREGLGFLISSYGQTFQVERLLGVIAITSLIGILFNEFLRWCDKRQNRWRGGV
ncbi:ABC transporter permease [Blastococcus aggregatus]|uniref:ABC transporter permease n=1 Tax=Blastococcus aggregatus TaxID=38502 RepID=UPI001596E5C2|nr:ABC transporter permease subunit [Blastococcus aggregatus]